MQLAQTLEHAVIEVPTVDERRNHFGQGLGAAGSHRVQRSNHPALEPGKALPLPSLHEEILLQHRQTHGRRPGVAIGAQRQIDPEDETILGHLADQLLQAASQSGEVFVSADHACAMGPPEGLSVGLVDVDQVDIGGDIEFARSELAHADDPEIDRPTLLVDHSPVALIEFRPTRTHRSIQRHLGQFGHHPGDRHHRCLLFDVEHSQPLHHQLPGDAQRRSQTASTCQQGVNAARHGLAVRFPRRQQAQVSGENPPDTLHKARMVGTDIGSHQRVSPACSRVWFRFGRGRIAECDSAVDPPLDPDRGSIC